MKNYEHKDCRYCFRSYFTEADQCDVPCEGISARGDKDTIVDNPTNRFLLYLEEINKVQDWVNTTKEEREKHFFFCAVCKDKVYLHGRIIPEYRHCRFQLTYPEWYPDFLRFRFITCIIRFCRI